MSKIPAHPSLWRYLGTPPGALSRDVFLRDFVSMGAGCGVAAAFRAPIAGTLFVVEEAASHFKREQLVKCFFAGIVALEVMVVITKGAGLLEYQVVTGVTCNIWSTHMGWSMVWFISIGVAC